MADYVYAVAVDTGPVLYMVHCEICDDELGIPTAEDAVLEQLEADHIAFHEA